LTGASTEDAIRNSSQKGCQEESLVFQEVEGTTSSAYADDNGDNGGGDGILIQENCSLRTWPFYLICTNIQQDHVCLTTEHQSVSCFVY
jgi:hypothetical protein